MKRELQEQSISQRTITNLQIALQKNTIRSLEQDISLEIDESVKTLIAKKGIDTNYGARPLKRSIQNILEDKIAEEILDGNLKAHKGAKIRAQEDKIVIE